MQLPAFLSLKWKLLLPLTLAMAIGTMALTWINDANLRREVQQARLDSATRNEALLRFLIQQNERQLVDAGSALADFIVAGRTGPLDLEAGFACSLTGTSSASTRVLKACACTMPVSRCWPVSAVRRHRMP